MAILYEHSTVDTHYEVRSAGKSVRLYTNGVFHSQWNPAHVIAGALWDLLVLPAFFLSNPPQRVLLLGVGGGAVVCQLRELFQPEFIQGVELDEVHLHIAEDWFGVPQKSGLTTQERMSHAEARQWLQNYQGPSFDYIIDDLFGHRNAEAARALKVDHHWSKLLFRHLEPAGVLVINFADRRELAQAVKVLVDNNLPASGCVQHDFDPTVYSFSHPRYENRIGVCFRNGRGREEWLLALSRCKKMTQKQKRRARGYHCRQLVV